jgi:hypothetical protein
LEKIKPFGAAPVTRQYITIKLLAEDAATAEPRVTSEPSHDNSQIDPSTTNRQISRSAQIAAVNAAASSAAARTNTKTLTSSQPKLNKGSVNLGFVYSNALRSEARTLKSLEHRLILL